MPQPWWTSRWLEALQRSPTSHRLARGRSYARRGHVIELVLGAGRVEAWVQGSRLQPYHVTLRLATLSRGACEGLIAWLRQEPSRLSALRARELPRALEQTFPTLFPALGRDLRTTCACPDWSNPCKHIAAVHYLLGEALERDPLLLFRLRGMPREQLDEAERPAELLPLDPLLFWHSGALPTELVEAATPARVLENIPSQGINAPLLEALLPVYSAAAARASQLLVGDWARADAASATRRSP